MADVDANGHTSGNYVSWKFTRIATNTTTVVKAAPGKLHAIVINTAGASANTIAVYNDANGTSNQIAAINGTAAAGSVFPYDAECTDGISIVTATGTAADLTVLWV